ncbi:MAG: DUF4307 domain-containing protein [Nocardioides sp.]
MASPPDGDLMRERYGIGRPGRRRLTVTAVAATGTVFLGWLAWSTWFHARPEIASELVSREITGDYTLTARIAVRRAEPSVSGICLVRALAEDHTVVGERSFGVPAGGDSTGAEQLLQTLRVEVRTERRATAVELIGCTAEGQPRPR